MQNLRIFENDTFETRAGMGYDPESNSIITMFRGSVNLINWILDFDFIKIDYTVGGCQDCRVHQGFHAAYTSLSVEMEAYMLEMVARYPGARIVVSGHSLGGAEAVMCAMAF
mmetsp:Transcript_22145/g.21368  ORF Transcript_22145/g.21368 Transcript_22145/m.21368 type:complete len:112 (+) Transcript_22145:374-709(+)